MGKLGILMMGEVGLGEVSRERVPLQKQPTRKIIKLSIPPSINFDFSKTNPLQLEKLER